MSDVRKHVLMAFVIGMMLGVGVMQLLAEDPVEPFPDEDGDGIADQHDMRPDGDAHLQFVLGQIVHDEHNESRNVTLVIGYNDDGRSDGTLSGQVCSLNLTLAANTTISHPDGICLFQVDDYAHRSVSFEYRLFHIIEAGPERAEVAWDIFPSSDDVSPWGVNSTVDPAHLGAGSRIDLSGLSDGDDWEHNARVEFVTNAVALPIAD